MDCNKDEAIRAKQLAENKMEKSDFEAARKIAVKAQNLYPELENISQLLSVCDVHCSAQKKVGGSEKDWYGILQVRTLSDEATVKKQYRRLALILHPDKNRFPGAEAAFKLICEANVVLSDPTKKSIYDSKIRSQTGYASVNLPPYHMNRSSHFNTHNHAYTHYSGVHQHQTMEPSFWTVCPFCSMKYQYQRKFLHTILCCQKCQKSFTGYETSAPASGVPWTPSAAQNAHAKPNMGQTSFHEWAVPGQSASTTGIHNAKGSSNPKRQQTNSRKPVRSKPGVRTDNVSGATAAAKVSGDLKSGGTSNNVNSMHGGNFNSDANTSKRAKLNKKSRKKGRKFTVESSESCDTSSSDSDVTINANLGDCGSDGPVHYPRRSTRKRQNISYHEDDEEEDDDDDDDDNLPNNLKSSEGIKLSDGAEEKEQNTSEGKNEEPGIQDFRQMETNHPEASMHNKDANGGKNLKKGTNEGGISSTGAHPIEIESDSEQDTFSNDDPSADISHCPDPEFSDFDKNREESCFDVNQFWACYDTLDSMPRFYAKVKKVHRNPFEVSLAWLEADPIDETCKKWREAELPIGCGNFKMGKTVKVSELPTFSHRINCDGGGRRRPFIIYPRKGEVWAIFKNWDFGWTSCLEGQRKYKYEVVEVLSEFNESQGIEVCYLDKVTGFVCLFEKSTHSEASFLVTPSEMLKFSHLIPSYRMMGSEREGVPKGSFELDPAALPLNSDDLDYPGKQKETSVPPTSASGKG